MNIDDACRQFGWAGGTIHQVAAELGMPGKGCELALMDSREFSKLLEAHRREREKQFQAARTTGKKI